MIPSATRVIRSLFQCVRSRLPDDRGDRRGPRHELPERQRQQVEQQRAEQQDRQPDVGRAEEAALGVDQLLVEDDRLDDRPRRHARGQEDHEDPGAAIHAGQCREGSRGAATRIQPPTGAVRVASTDEPHRLADAGVLVERRHRVELADAVHVDHQPHLLRRDPRRRSPCRSARPSGSTRKRRAAYGQPRGGIVRDVWPRRGSATVESRTIAAAAPSQHPGVAEEEGGLGVDGCAPDLVDRALLDDLGRPASPPAGRRR